MKLAIVVGHNARQQGAVRPDTGESEFSWNSDLAKMILEEARAYPSLEVKVFKRTYGGGYRKEIERVYGQVDAWGADYSCELHFNSHVDPNATGSEVLTSGSRRSVKFANALQREFLDLLNLKDRGLKVRNKGRGGFSLIAGRAAAVLIEPFFASSRNGQRATDTPREKRALARAILHAAHTIA